MKVLLLSRVAAHPVASVPDLTVVPDSAIVPGGRPVFLPESPSDWRASLLTAFRVGRLGKNIAARFANRYIDGVAPMVHLSPEGVDAGSRPLMGCLDGAVTHGRWRDLTPDAAAEMLTANLTLSLNGRRAVVTPAELALGEVIEAVSRLTTLKTGDIIVPLDTQLFIPAYINLHVEAIIEGCAPLEYNIK